MTKSNLDINVDMSPTHESTVFKGVEPHTISIMSNNDKTLTRVMATACTDFK